MTLQPQARVVLIDWNFVQSMSPATCLIPDDWELVLPDVAIHEVVDKLESDPGNTLPFFQKLLQFCRQNCARIYVGVHAGAVCSAYPKGGVTLEGLIDFSTTKVFRERLKT